MSRRLLVLTGETLNHYGVGGGIHFCWQDAKGNATPRKVEDDHVRQWFESTEDGRSYKDKGYRLVHLPTIAGPCVVPDVRRVDTYTLSLEGETYTISGARMPDGQVNYHDLHVHAEVKGRTVEVQNWSIKHSLLDYINNEDALETQR